MRTLAVVSGGDAPGINTALWQFTRIATANGDSILGILGGFPAVLNSVGGASSPSTSVGDMGDMGEMVSLTAAALLPWSGQPGSFLPSSREPVLGQPDARHRLNAA